MRSEKAFGVFSERRRLQSGGGEDRNRNRILAELATPVPALSNSQWMPSSKSLHLARDSHVLILRSKRKTLQSKLPEKAAFIYI